MIHYVFYVKFEDGSGEYLTVPASSYAEAHEKMAKKVIEYGDKVEAVWLEDITYGADIEVFEEG